VSKKIPTAGEKPLRWRALTLTPMVVVIAEIDRFGDGSLAWDPAQQL
jgi:hypothetical protein